MADVEKVITNLELVKASIEWEEPLDYQIMLDEAIQTIRELQEQIPKLHLVSDGDLPSDDREVLCVDVWGTKYVAFFKDNEWSDGGEYSEIEVIAWMELPKFEQIVKE